MSKKHLVLVGGGHAHLTTLVHINKVVQQGHKVTLVSPTEYHYYSGMGPGLLSGIYKPQQVRFNLAALCEKGGASFCRGRVDRVDPEERKLLLEGDEELSYDIVSFNTGSDVIDFHPLESGNGRIPVKPISMLHKARTAIRAKVGGRSLRLVVAGGGPAGVEIAGNLERLIRTRGGQASIQLIGGSRLLSGFPDKVRRLALDSLERRGIRVTEGRRVESVEKGVLALDNGSSLPYDFLFWATGIKPSDIFIKSDMPVGKEGGLLVNSFLQSIAYPEIFGGGDCICLQHQPLAKVGVYAVRENPILFHNIVAALDNRPLKEFSPQKKYLLILNLGDDRGIFRRGSFVWYGRIPFRIKDAIDRQFMKTFQRCGELQEFWNADLDL